MRREHAAKIPSMGLGSLSLVRFEISFIELANAKFAVLGPYDFDAVSATFPSRGVDLAPEDTPTACETRSFVGTANWDANVNRLAATGAWVG